MNPLTTPLSLLHTLHHTMVGLVGAQTPDLSARQMAIFLRVYLDPNRQTVRGLALALKVSKPAITRGFDRLCELGLLERVPDLNDRRSVFAGRTLPGTKYLQAIQAHLLAATAMPAPAAPAKPTMKKPALAGVAA